MRRPRDPNDQTEINLTNSPSKRLKVQQGNHVFALPVQHGIFAPGNQNNDPMDLDNQNNQNQPQNPNHNNNMELG